MDETDSVSTQPKAFEESPDLLPKESSTYTDATDLDLGSKTPLTSDSDSSINVVTMLPATRQDQPRKRYDILLWLGIILILIALAIAGFLLWRHFSAQATYNHMTGLTGFDFKQLDDKDFVPTEEDLSIDWDSLRRINPDIIGWIYIPNTQLGYPIVQGRDNKYYLNHTADGNVNASGAIFLDYENSADLGDRSNFIYGHNMLGNAMFSEMTNYVNEQFIRDHPRIFILTPDKTYDLTVIGAIKCHGTDPVRRIHFTGDSDFFNYLNTLGNYMVSGKYSDLMGASNVYCFSTCELFDTSSRIIVIATDNNREGTQAENLSQMLAVAAGGM
ncbi:MAG: class B sortase [Coriobacteriales bacterium]|nr:class B sortase [Coriobacteriales bacterium]